MTNRRDDERQRLLPETGEGKRCLSTLTKITIFANVVFISMMRMKVRAHVKDMPLVLLPGGLEKCSLMGNGRLFPVMSGVVSSNWTTIGTMIEICIIPPPPGPNILNSKHWSYRHKLKKRILNEVWGQMVGKYIRTPILVHACRYSIQTMDTDNLIASLKIILDSIAAVVQPPKGMSDGQWKRWADAPMHLSLGRITQERVGKRKDEKIVMRIEQGEK